MTSEPAAAVELPSVAMDADDFVLFELPRQFVQDRHRIDMRWKLLQGQVHPDRHAAEGPAARLAAMQWTLRVNEAYQRLRAPLSRAAYLCELHGMAIEAERNTAMPGAFLMQQMAWREALDEARSVAALEALNDDVAARQQALQDELARLIDQRRDWPAAAAQVRALMFVTRFAEDVNRRLDVLGA